MQTTIKIQGQKIKVHFNYRAIRAYEKETGLSYVNILSDVTDENPKTTAVIGLLYAGMAGAGTSPDIEEVASMAMKLTAEELTGLYTAYIESLPKPEPKSDTEEKPEKAPEPVGE